MGDLVSAVFVGYVFDDFLAAFVVKVNVAIWHGYALGVEEAFEDEVVV